MASAFVDAALIVSADWTAAAATAAALESVFPAQDNTANVWWQGVEGVVELAAGMIILRQLSATLSPAMFTIPGEDVIYDAIAVSFFYQYSPNAQAKLNRVRQQIESFVRSFVK